MPLWRIAKIVFARFLLVIEIAYRSKWIILTFGSNYFRGFGYLDLLIFRVCGCRVIAFVSHGSEARHPLWNGFELAAVGPSTHDFSEMQSTIKKLHRRLRWLAILSDALVASPRRCHLLPIGRYINQDSIGLPNRVDIAGVKGGGDESAHVEGQDVIAVPLTARTRVILHAPSNPEAKGTSLIVDAVGALKDEGFQVELDLLTNVPSTEVATRLALCDFVVDQCFGDGPASGLAVEAACMSKPTVLGVMCQLNPKHFEVTGLFPAVRSSPDQMLDNIRLLLTDPSLAHRVGLEARGFVEDHFAPSKVATRLMHAIETPGDSMFWFNSADSGPPVSAGRSAADTARIVHEYVAQYGWEATRLNWRHLPLDL